MPGCRWQNAIWMAKWKWFIGGCALYQNHTVVNAQRNSPRNSNIFLLFAAVIYMKRCYARIENLDLSIRTSCIHHWQIRTEWQNHIIWKRAWFYCLATESPEKKNGSWKYLIIPSMRRQTETAVKTMCMHNEVRAVQPYFRVFLYCGHSMFVPTIPS